MAEKSFLRNNFNWYALYSIFATFLDFEKSSSFFRQNLSIFLKKH